MGLQQLLLFLILSFITTFITTITAIPLPFDYIPNIIENKTFNITNSTNVKCNCDKHCLTLDQIIYLQEYKNVKIVMISEEIPSLVFSLLLVIGLLLTLKVLTIILIYLRTTYKQFGCFVWNCPFCNKKDGCTENCPARGNNNPVPRIFVVEKNIVYKSRKSRSSTR